MTPPRFPTTKGVTLVNFSFRVFEKLITTITFCISYSHPFLCSQSTPPCENNTPHHVRSISQFTLKQCPSSIQTYLILPTFLPPKKKKKTPNGFFSFSHGLPLSSVSFLPCNGHPFTEPRHLTKCPKHCGMRLPPAPTGPMCTICAGLSPLAGSTVLR